MNLESYEVLQQIEEIINRQGVVRFIAKFTCPDEAFKFELISKITGETSVFFVISNDMPEDYANKLADVIMGGLGYERNENYAI